MRYLTAEHKIERPPPPSLLRQEFPHPNPGGHARYLHAPPPLSSGAERTLRKNRQGVQFGNQLSFQEEQQFVTNFISFSIKTSKFFKTHFKNLTQYLDNFTCKPHNLQETQLSTKIP